MKPKDKAAFRGLLDGLAGGFSHFRGNPEEWLHTIELFWTILAEHGMKTVTATCAQ